MDGKTIKDCSRGFTDFRCHLESLVERRGHSRDRAKKLFSNIKGDLLGGISAAIITFPSSVAYGLIVFAPLGTHFAPQAALSGLYAAVFAGFFVSLFGGTALQINGPKAPLTLVMASVVTGLIANVPFQGSIAAHQASIVGLTFLCVFIGGVFQILFGAVRVGSLIKYLPYPVFAGFLNGIAVLLILSQIRPLIGVTNNNSIYEILTRPGMIQPLTLLIGISTVVVIFLTRRFIRVIPASLMGLCVGTSLYYILLHFAGNSSLGSTVGNIPTGLPHLDPVLNWFNMVSTGDALPFLPIILVSGLALGLLGSIDSLLSSVASDRLTDSRHDSNRELMAQGVGNLVGSCFGGLSSAGSAFRTMASFKAGGRTRLAGIVCSFCIFLIVIAFGPFVGKIPLAVIAGIVIAVAINMFDRWTISLLTTVVRGVAEGREITINLAVTLLVAVITVCVSLLVALGVGFVLASVLFISKMGRSVIKRKYRGDQIRSKAMRCPEHNRLLEYERREIAVFELQGPIFFGTAENLAVDIETLMQEATYCILDLKRVNEIDSTGANIILQTHDRLKKQKKYLIISYLRTDHPLWNFLVYMNVVSTVGEKYFFSDTDTALEWAEDHLLANSLQVSDPCSAQGLEQMNITAGFTPEELEVFAGHLTGERYQKGERILREGDTDKDLFILTRGVVSIKTQLMESSRTKRLLTYSPGVIFGEFSFLDGNPRSADVWAEENSEILRLSQSKFAALRIEYPGITIKLTLNLARELSQRLRQASAEVRMLEDS